MRLGARAVMARRRVLAVALLVTMLPALTAAQVVGEATTRLRAGPLDITLRFGDDRMRQLESQIRPVLTGALERYLELFGGPPRGTDGMPLTSLVVRLVPDPVGGGVAEPGLLTVGVSRQPSLGFYDWRAVMMHEAFHLWSGGSFRHAGPGEQWFHEGVAEFYSQQTAARLGIVDEATTIRNAGTMAGFYASALDQHRLTLIEAGQQPGAHHFLVHAGGWAAALLLDHGIRTKTGNARSLDDLLRWMYTTFAAPGQRYGTMDVARGVQAATGTDMTEFFARYIMGRLPLPLSASANLGELSRSLQGRRAGVPDVAAPDSVLMHSLGLVERRR